MYSQILASEQHATQLTSGKEGSVLFQTQFQEASQVDLAREYNTKTRQTKEKATCEVHLPVAPVNSVNITVRICDNDKKKKIVLWSSKHPLLPLFTHSLASPITMPL